jgi:toxin ParE1/3/4
VSIHLSDLAKIDLAHIIAYLQPRSPMAALRVSQELERAILGLLAFPLIGRSRSELGQDVRSLVAGIHVIFYRAESHRILILRVLDGRMDVETELLR